MSAAFLKRLRLPFVYDNLAAFDAMSHYRRHLVSVGPDPNGNAGFVESLGEVKLRDSSNDL
jgi:hypothetical protein